MYIASYLSPATPALIMISQIIGKVIMFVKMRSTLLGRSTLVTQFTKR